MVEDGDYEPNEYNCEDGGVEVAEPIPRVSERDESANNEECCHKEDKKDCEMIPEEFVGPLKHLESLYEKKIRIQRDSNVCRNNQRNQSVHAFIILHVLGDEPTGLVGPEFGVDTPTV